MSSMTRRDFVVDPLMIASTLDSRHGDVYREQAVFQLRAYIDVFLNKETKLAKTMLLKDGIGKTYWTRASGWLLWSITGVLRHLPPQDRRFAGFVADFRTLAEGISRALTRERAPGAPFPRNGGNRPGSPGYT